MAEKCAKWTKMYRIRPKTILISERKCTNYDLKLCKVKENVPNMTEVSTDKWMEMYQIKPKTVLKIERKCTECDLKLCSEWKCIE